jgi:three-Cys-motif partner protein
MDLVINYPEGGLNRYMRQASEQDANTRIDLFFGTRSWRDIYTTKLKSGQGDIHRLLIDLYKSRLHELGYQEVRQGQEFGGDEPLMRNAKQAPLYRLLFASKHELGQDFWRKVTRRDLYGQARLFDAT